MNRYTRRGGARLRRVDLLIGRSSNDARVAEAVRTALAGYTPGAGELLHVEVEHEDGCPYLRGRGACRCAPKARIVEWWREKGATA